MRKPASSWRRARWPRARLGADDVTLAEHDIADLPSGYVTDLDRAVGRNLLRPLAQG